MRRTHLTLRSLALLTLAAASLAGCAGTRSLTDPVVRVWTEGGAELGVSTDYGVVYLGRSATRGAVQVEARFGDGPSLEASTAVPVGGGLYTAPMQIQLPSVAISFAPTVDGETLVVAGRTEGGDWEATVQVVEDPRVLGLLVTEAPRMPDRVDQVGAGVFRVLGPHERELVGLVSGRLTLGDETYLAVVGPEHLWRLVSLRRDHLQRKPWVYRADIL